MLMRMNSDLYHKSEHGDLSSWSGHHWSFSAGYFLYKLSIFARLYHTKGMLFIIHAVAGLFTTFMALVSIVMAISNDDAIILYDQEILDIHHMRSLDMLKTNSLLFQSFRH